MPVVNPASSTWNLKIKLDSFSLWQPSISGSEDHTVTVLLKDMVGAMQVDSRSPYLGSVVLKE